MYYLRIENDKFGFVVKGIHKILESDISITDNDYKTFLKRQEKGEQFKLKAEPTGSSLFDYIESFETEYNDVLPESPIDKIKENMDDLEERLVNVVATTWDIDYRLLELEWTLEDAGLTGISLVNTFNINKNIRGGKTMALSRYEEAKIMILGGAYDKATLTKQLTRYLEKNIITKEEYDELIALMEAKELVTGE